MGRSRGSDRTGGVTGAPPQPSPASQGEKVSQDRRVKVHVALPNGHRGVTIDQLAEITAVAVALGLAGVWPLDHVLVGPDLKDRYPWVIEPLTLLGYLAARTSRIRLGTSVIVLGMRNPFVVAKQAATLGDVWQSTGLKPEEFRVKAEQVRWYAEGRRVEVGARTTLAGDPDEVLAKVRAYEESGADHVCAYFGSSGEDFVPGMRTFAREVMPAFDATNA